MHMINDTVSSSKYDIILFQETKNSNVPLPLVMSEYKVVNFPSKKPNYCGTLSAVKHSPISIAKGIEDNKIELMNFGMKLKHKKEALDFIENVRKHAANQLRGWERSESPPWYMK